MNVQNIKYSSVLCHWMPQCIWFIYQYETCTPHFWALVRCISDFLFFFLLISNTRYTCYQFTDWWEWENRGQCWTTVHPPHCPLLVPFDICVQGQKLHQYCYELLSNRGDDVFTVHGSAVNKIEGLNVGRQKNIFIHEWFAECYSVSIGLISSFYMKLKVEKVGNGLKPLRIRMVGKISTAFYWRGFVVLYLCVGVWHKELFLG